MLETTLCELSILQILFWGFVVGMLYQMGRELVDYIFHRNDYDNEEDS